MRKNRTLYRPLGPRKAHRDHKNLSVEAAGSAETPPHKKSFAKRVRDSWIFLLFEIVGFFAVIATLWAIWIELGDRREERIARHWQLVTSKAGGEGGKSMALQFLVGQGVDLAGIDLSSESMGDRVYITSVDLSGANFRSANLQGVVFEDVNLNGANFEFANMPNAIFYGTNLDGVRFFAASLQRATFSPQGQLLNDTGEGLHRGIEHLTTTTFTNANLAGAGFYEYCIKNGTGFAGAIVDGTTFDVESDDRQCLPILESTRMFTSEHPYIQLHRPLHIKFESAEWEAYDNTAAPTKCYLSPERYPDIRTDDEIMLELLSDEFYGDYLGDFSCPRLDTHHNDLQ